DVWVDISAADLAFLTTEEPRRVAAAYRSALADAPAFATEADSKQLAIYGELGVLSVNLAEVFKVVGEPPASQPPPSKGKRVLLFAGHMIDDPGRKRTRFPAEKEQVAREKIKQAIVAEMNSSTIACGYAGGASGGDILFQEVCAELGIQTRLYLAMPPQNYVTASVQKAGNQWVERFWALHDAHQQENMVPVLSQVTDAPEEQDYLPIWLRSKPQYGIWQRNNLWMLFNALDEAYDPTTGDPNIALIALWDGESGDGPGGTRDLIDKVQQLGASVEIIDTKEVFGLISQNGD